MQPDYAVLSQLNTIYNFNEYNDIIWNHCNIIKSKSFKFPLQKRKALLINANWNMLPTVCINVSEDVVWKFTHKNGKTFKKRRYICKPGPGIVHAEWQKNQVLPISCFSRLLFYVYSKGTYIFPLSVKWKMRKKYWDERIDRKGKFIRTYICTFKYKDGVGSCALRCTKNTLFKDFPSISISIKKKIIFIKNFAFHSISLCLFPLIWKIAFQSFCFWEFYFSFVNLFIWFFKRSF